jgi:hypothetical protein
VALEQQDDERFYLLSGMIDKSCGESEHITIDGDPLAELVEDLTEKFLTVRYWITDEPIDLNKAIETTVEQAMGFGDCDFQIHHSDRTGYLWTDEDFKVGGHDMIAEMGSFIGKHVLMEIEVGPGNDITRKMQDMFRSSYKGANDRDFDIDLDPDGTASDFTAYRGIFGGMVVCHLIFPPEWTGGRMIIWFFRRAKSTPIRLETWGGSVKTYFPEGSRDPRLIQMSPTDQQRHYMTNPQWQPYRVRRVYGNPSDGGGV